MNRQKAIQIIKNNWPTGRSMLSEALEYLIPELKESEDERIRKWIKKELESKYVVDDIVNNEMADKAFAWLEKQGHTDSIIEKAKTEKQRIIITETDGNANIDWDTRSLEDARELLECGLQYINTELEKQGEQKPADKKYTFNAIPRLLSMIQPTNRAKAYCQKLIDILIQEGYSADAKIVGNCLKQMNGEKVAMATMDKQKPVEWSEKDEIGLGDALWAIQQARTIAKNENEMGGLWYAEKWLKSLKQRMKESKA